MGPNAKLAERFGTTRADAFEVLDGLIEVGFRHRYLRPPNRRTTHSAQNKAMSMR